MKKRYIIPLAVCVLAVAALTLGLTLRRGHPEENDANYGQLLTDLVTAYEHEELLRIVAEKKEELMNIARKLLNRKK